MREGKKNLVVGSAILLSIALLSVGGLYWRQASAFTLFIAFEDAKKLQVGDSVYMKGLRIGDVTDVTFDADTDKIRVKIKLKEKYKTHLRAKSAFLIRKDKFILGKMCVEAVVLDKESPPLEKGTVLQGCESHAEFYWRIIKSKVTLEEIGDILRDISESVEDPSVSEEERIEAGQ